MAGGAERHACEGGALPAAPPMAGLSLTLQHPPVCAKSSRPVARSKDATQPRNEEALRQKLERIQSCLQTIALLVESNHAYLPIFLRLEQELEAEQKIRDTIERSKKYLPASD